MLSVKSSRAANTVSRSRRDQALLPNFREHMPASVTLDVQLDRSTPIRESVRDVQITLLLTLGLVVTVIFLFLRNLSATLIPSLALPLSIVVTFAVMYLLGYSAEQPVADGADAGGRLRRRRRDRDAREHRAPHGDGQDADGRRRSTASREIGFTIVSMTLSLAAVFVPVLFMGGIVGRLLHEFAVTIALAILVSGFVSLTLTPMLCSRLLRARTASGTARSTAPPSASFDAMAQLYDRRCAGCCAIRA